MHNLLIISGVSRKTFLFFLQKVHITPVLLSTNMKPYKSSQPRNAHWVEILSEGYFFSVNTLSKFLKLNLLNYFNQISENLLVLTTYVHNNHDKLAFA